MQDFSTGHMVPLDAEQYGIDRQSAKDSAIPIREHQGPVFTVGEELEIKGGRFKVHAIYDKRIYLDSIKSK